MSKNATSGDRHKNESTEDKPTASPHPDKKRWFGDAISVFTALLTIATFLLVFVGLLQWSTLEKTDLTQRMINRAFIVPVITGVNLDVSHNLGVKLWTWVPQWENAGNTSSVNLTVETHCGGLPFAADEPRFEEHPGKPGKRVIGPHQRALGVICAFDAAGMQKHLDGTYRFYTLLRARYQDIFGAPHVLESCTKNMKFVEGSSLSTPSIVIAFGAPCDTHNCTDEQCEAQK